MGSSSKDTDAILLEKNRLLELENEQLHKRLQELVVKLASYEGKRAPEQLSLELKLLTEQVQSLRGHVFGDSSEKRTFDKPPKESSKIRATTGRTAQDRLPHVQTLVELADDDRDCPACAGTLEEMKGQTEDCEVIDIVHRKFLVRRILRQKYRCRCQQAIVVAPPSAMHIPHGRYTLDFGVYSFVQKYAWHEPLDRQRRSMKSDGLVVTTQTLWDQVAAIAKRLEPIYDCLREYIVGADVIGVDETWWRLLDKKARKRWWIWAIQSGDAVYFRAAPSRSAATAMSVLAGFEGTAVCDAYKAYETVSKETGTVKLALCWAHVRRKFVEAEPNYSQCGTALDLIAQLYAVDRDSDDPTHLSGDAKLQAAEARLRNRAERAPAILAELRDWALEQRGLPKSTLRKAIDYMLGHWDSLSVFISDPFVPLDNNTTERALRGIVVGRKNHYGSRSERGTKVAAIAYSLIESAKLAGLDPFGYINAAVHGIVMGQSPEELLPLPELWPEATC